MFLLKKQNRSLAPGVENPLTHIYDCIANGITSFLSSTKN